MSNRCITYVHIIILMIYQLCSAVLILASLLVYNNESLEDFNARAVRLALGKSSDADLTKMNPRLCESHSIKCVSRKAKAVCKGWQIEFAIYCFVGLSHQQSLQQLQQLYAHVSRVMCTRLSTAQVDLSFSAIQKVTDNLDLGTDDTADDEGDDANTRWELCTTLTCNIDALFEVVTTCAPVPTETKGLSPNRYYMPTFHQYLKSQWMACFGLWTRVLDVRGAQHKTPLPVTQSKTDGEIEQVHVHVHVCIQTVAVSCDFYLLGVQHGEELLLPPKEADENRPFL